MTRDAEATRRLRSGIEASVKGAPATSRASFQRTRSRLLAAGLVASLMALVATGGVHIEGRPPTLVYGALLGWTAAAVAGAWLALDRRRTMLGPPTRSLVLAAVVLGPAVLGWFLLLRQLHGAASEASVPASLHVTCFAFTLAYAAGPLLALVLAHRAIDPVHPRATGALLFAAMGAAGGALIVLHCWIGETWHVTLGHVLPLVALTVAGALAGGRLFGTSVLPGSGRVG